MTTKNQHRKIAVYPKLINYIDAHSAIALSQLIYWFKKNNWKKIQKKDEQFSKEICATKKQLQRIKIVLSNKIDFLKINGTEYTATQTNFIKTIDDIFNFCGKEKIAVNPAFIEITGDAHSAIALSQIIFWQKKMNRYIWKKDKELAEEICATDKQIRRIKANLKKLPFVKISLHKAQGLTQTHYEIDMSLLEIELETKSPANVSKLDTKPPANVSKLEPKPQYNGFIIRPSFDPFDDDVPF